MTAQPGAYGVARCAAGSSAPSWATGPGLVHVTEAEEETSVVCLQDRIPDSIEAALDWAVFRVDTLTALDVPGIVAAAVHPVAEAGCGVVAISTYLRDYILIQHSQRDRVIASWLSAGHCLKEQFEGHQQSRRDKVGPEFSCPPRIGDAEYLELRRAGPGDCTALAACHHRLWHETYGGIAPVAILTRFDLQGREAYWSARLARAGAADMVMLVLLDGEICGFCALQPQEHAGALGDLQIKHLFVDAALRGRRVGQKLLRLALHQACRLGFSGVSLNVVKENQAATGFYEAMGGKCTGEYTDPGPLWQSKNLLYRWEC